MNQAFETTRIVDAFQSLIWTDKYIGYGEFELRLPMSDNALAGIRVGWYASIRESDRYMIVDGIEITTSFENGNLATIKGRSLESLLERRIVRYDSQFHGRLQSAITSLVNANLITGNSEANRRISRMIIRESLDTIINSNYIDRVVNAGENLYDVVYELCDLCKIGFRVLPGKDGSMTFELYSGKDRTYDQSANPWIVFSPRFENIKDTSMVIDTENLRTTVYGNLTFTRRVTKLIDGEYKETDEEVTINEILNNSYSGVDRRELYYKSNLRPDYTIDKSSFGTASSMVNRMDYCTYMEVYFNRSAYEKAMDEYNEKLRDAYVPRKEDEEKWVWHEKDPSDPTYVPEGVPGGVSVGDPAGINRYWTLETIPGDTIEQWQKNNERYYSIMENECPDMSDYMDWDWVLTNVDGYQNALNAAQAEIDAAYQRALDNQTESMRKSLINEMEAYLSKYLTITEFDGELDPNVQHKFGNDYYLGDLVQIVNEYNFQAITRVAGITFTEEVDAGIVIYPTFESDDKAVVSL